MTDQPNPPPQRHASRRAIPPRECAHCGQTFQPNRLWQKLCSYDCVKGAARERIAAQRAREGAGGAVPCPICSRAVLPHRIEEYERKKAAGAEERNTAAKSREEPPE